MLDQNHSAKSIRAGTAVELMLTHVPLKKTSHRSDYVRGRDISFVRTADAMLLHGGNFLKGEPGCIYHEGKF